MGKKIEIDEDEFRAMLREEVAAILEETSGNKEGEESEEEQEGEESEEEQEGEESEEEQEGEEDLSDKEITAQVSKAVQIAMKELQRNKSSSSSTTKPKKKIAPVKNGVKESTNKITPKKSGDVELPTNPNKKSFWD